MRPLRNARAVRVQIVDEVDDVVGKIDLAICTEQVGHMNLEYKSQSISGNYNNPRHRKVRTDPSMGKTFIRLLTV